MRVCVCVCVCVRVHVCACLSACQPVRSFFDSAPAAQTKVHKNSAANDQTRHGDGIKQSETFSDPTTQHLCRICRLSHSQSSLSHPENSVISMNSLRIPVPELPGVKV